MMYLESEFSEAINTESAVLMGCDMVNTIRAFKDCGNVLVIDNPENLPTKYHNLMVDFNDLSEAAQDKIKPLEVV